MNFSLDKKTFTDLINLRIGTFKPLKFFCTQKQVKSILNDFTINKKFFPIPIVFGLKKKQYLRLKKTKIINLNYKKKFVASVKINNFFCINKIEFGKKIFGCSSKKHPGYKVFDEYYKFLDINILKFNEKSINFELFDLPNEVSKKLSKFKNTVGFHTRNVPHRGHEWIHYYGLKKCNAILVQPLIGQFKKKEFKESVIIKKNNELVMRKSNNFIFSILNSYPRYAGPREAVLHALIRKNFGCTHFLVGRDHAGYKNFYKKYESQSFCKKVNKKIGIQIISFKEPQYCTTCKLITNKKCKYSKCKFKSLNGSLVRKYIFANKKVPSYLMSKYMSDKLKKSCLIK